MIVLSNVCKTFDSAQGGVVAVDDVNLTVEAGQIYGIIGYSGAGKSTLIRLLNGLETPSSGSIQVEGFDIAGAEGNALRQARLKISMVFQHFNLLWSRTVSQNIAFSMQIAGVPKAQIKPRVAELVALVGLQGREDAYPSQLSGGQKQRVGIARALANNPGVLLCDEATSALDPQTTDSILDLLLDINRKLNLTIVLITHEMHVVRKICHRVAVMENGRIVEEGPVIDVFTRPQQPITQQFVKTGFAISGNRGKLQSAVEPTSVGRDFQADVCRRADPSGGDFRRYPALQGKYQHSARQNQSNPEWFLWRTLHSRRRQRPANRQHAEAVERATDRR
jgi:D-methionine transport system ATP-binding protein